MNLFRKACTTAAALIVGAIFIVSCASPEQTQRRKLKKLDDRRDIELGYIGSCNYTKIEGVCVNFYANINTTMKKFALKGCEIIESECDRMNAERVCLDPSEKGTAKIQYEFYFPKGASLEEAQKACTGGSRELVTL